MSYATIATSFSDVALRKRIEAALAKEAWANPTLGATATGQIVQRDGPTMAATRFVWAICIDNEAAYAYAIGTGNANPGGDEGVITDGALGAGIQAHWPS